jgi:hypothetical protein
MARNGNKLEKVNVPELFYQRFLSDRDTSSSTLLQRLAETPTSKHGRGMTRILETVTEAEWEELYGYAAEGRAHQQGTKDREFTLRAAICAGKLAERMEELGVANPVEYTPKRRKAVADDQPTATVPATPPTLEVEDEPETEEEEFGNDLNLGSGW